MKKRLFNFIVKKLLATKQVDEHNIPANEQNRVRWVVQKLQDLQSGLRILDAGAGEQRYRSDCSHLAYVSQDFAEYDGKGNDHGLQMGDWDYGKLDIVSDISMIPEPDDSFDVILCSEVFEHIPNPVLALREFSRLLKKDGQLILTAPFCSITHFAPYHFSTGFSKYYYEKHLSDFGFEIKEMEFNGNYFDYLIQELDRLPAMAQQYSDDFLDTKEFASREVMKAALSRYSAKDTSSQEMLCFGIHVMAIKAS
ncbi:MAG: class I SAM-dependent methyltransferase [Cyclobacteriaceae bacterium]